MRVLLVFVLLLSVACGEQGTVPVGSRLLIEGSADFGDVAMGFVAERTLTLTNISNAELPLNGVEDGAGFDGELYAFSVLNLPSSLAANGSATFKVGFQAFSLMDAAAESSFSVRTAFGSEPVAVRGRGVRALSVEPVRLDFGSVLRGESKA